MSTCTTIQIINEKPTTKLTSRAQCLCVTRFIPPSSRQVGLNDVAKPVFIASSQPADRLKTRALFDQVVLQRVTHEFRSRF